jgi:FecR protein
MTRGLLMSVPLVALVVALTAAGAEKAISGTSAIADSGDPPARVARLNYLSGSVSFQPAGTEEWVSATLNRPLTAGDSLWTENSAKAELHIGSTAMRLGSESSFAFLDLDDRAVQVKLTEGLMNIRLRQLDEFETFEVDTPSAAISLLRPGEYRFTVDASGNQTLVVARGGDVEVSGTGQAFTVHRGQQARISANGTLTYDVTAAPPVDEFDQFCQARDRREEKSHATKYVSREMTGYEDLDDYGDWRPHPEFGVVWVPRTVVAGWTPYRFGHWIWIEPWGWTWVDDAPWGFAPFHYGRWAHIWGRWGWVPGPYHVRPIYAPALVVFVGGTDFWFRIGIGGGVGWFPLAPWEVYAPAYRCSRTYLSMINVRNLYNLNERYGNRTVPRAMVAMPRDAFAGGRRAGQFAVDVPGREVLNARVHDAPPVTPTMQSLGRVEFGERVVRPRAGIAERPVFVRRTPPAPIPFSERQELLRANPGHPLDRQTTEQLRRRQAEAARPGSVPRVKEISPSRQSADRMRRPEGATAPPRVTGGQTREREQGRRQIEADRERQQRSRQIEKDRRREDRAIQDETRRQQRSIEKEQRSRTRPQVERGESGRRRD